MRSNADIELSANECISLNAEDLELISDIRSPRSPEFIKLNYRDFPLISKNFLHFMDRHLTNLNKKHKAFLDNLSFTMTTDMSRFVSALRVANSNRDLENPTLEETNEISHANEIIKSFSLARVYRLYMPEELKKIKNIILGLLRGIEIDRFLMLFNDASEEKRYRLPDLLDEPAFLEEAIILSMQTAPSSLTEFIEITFFFIELAEEKRGFYDEALQGTPHKKQTVRNQTKDDLKKNQEYHLNRFNQYRNTANQIQENPLELILVGEDTTHLKDIIAKLNFSSDTALAYHVKKHLKELPENKKETLYPQNLKEEIKQIYADTSYYLIEARETIRMAMNRVPPDYEISYCQFNKHPIFKFYNERNVDGKIFTLLSIVKCNADGHAYIATHMDSKR